MAALVPSSSTALGLDVLRLRSRLHRHQRHSYGISACSMRQEDNDLRSDDSHGSEADMAARWRNNLGRAAFATLAAGLLLTSPGDGMAASGGRVGGSAFRSSAPPSKTYNNNSRTNIYIRPPPLVGPPPVVIAPPLYGGYGFGFPFFGPPPVVLGPSVAVGFSLFDLLPIVLVFVVVGAFFNSFRRNDDYDD